MRKAKKQNILLFQTKILVPLRILKNVLKKKTEQTKSPTSIINQEIAEIKEILDSDKEKIEKLEQDFAQIKEYIICDKKFRENIIFKSNLK